MSESSSIRRALLVYNRKPAGRERLAPNRLATKQTQSTAGSYRYGAVERTILVTVRLKQLSDNMGQHPYQELTVGFVGRERWRVRAAGENVSGEKCGGRVGGVRTSTLRLVLWVPCLSEYRYLRAVAAYGGRNRWKARKKPGYDLPKEHYGGECGSAPA